MIIPASGVDKTLGVNLHKVFKTSPAGEVGPVDRRDAVSISSFSSLVERGRTIAMALPDVREDRVAQVRKALLSGA